MEEDRWSLRLLLVAVLMGLGFFGYLLSKPVPQDVPKPKSKPIEVKSYEDRLEDEALSGDAAAMLRMGDNYRYGYNGLAPDFAQAMAWYEKAAKKGNSDAMHAMALMYKNGDGVDVDYEQAAKLLKKAIKAGNSSSIIALANMHYFGHGLEQNYEKAYALWEEAAEKGNPEAMYNLSRAYYKGIGVEREYLRAGKYLFMASEHGDDYAKGLIGKYSRKCSHTRVGAKIYYDMPSCFMAAHSGDVIAMHAVGLAFYDGRFDQSVDYEKAFEWFKKSGEAGYSMAQYFLGMFYEQGLGMDSDKVEGYAWIGTGLAQEDYSVEMRRKAEQYKDMIYRAMSEELRLEADEKLKVYIEKYTVQKEEESKGTAAESSQETPYPPSTDKSVPVTHSDSSEAR